jgi:hypothetical protein
MALLWNPESWSQRLAELEAQSGELKLRRARPACAPYWKALAGAQAIA